MSVSVFLFFFPRGTLGSLRLQLRLRDEVVLPSSHYKPLTELLSQSVGSQLNVSLMPFGLSLISGNMPVHYLSNSHGIFLITR